MTDEVQVFAEALDKFILAEVSKNPLHYFKKAFTYDELKTMYKPLIHEHERCKPTVRTKINLGSVRCRDKNNQQIPEPEDWKSVQLSAQITVKSLCIMGNQFGVTLEVHDVQMDPDDKISPFALDL